MEEFNRIWARLNLVNNSSKFKEINGLSLYQLLFQHLKLDDKAQYNKLLELSKKLARTFIINQDYETILELFQIEYEFFQKEFGIENHHLQTQKTTNNFSEDDVINFQPIIEQFEKSYKGMIDKWEHLDNKFLECISESDKLENKQSKEIYKKMKILTRESNFHINHFLNFLKIQLDELEKIYKKFQKLSLTDDLTKLRNRRYLYLSYPNLFYLANRQQVPICFYLLDIDDFKKINDMHGHQKGDEVIIKIANIMENNIRRSDILVRFGGDEFLAIFFDTTFRDAKMIAEMINSLILEEEFKSDYTDNFHVTASSGISCQKIETLKPDTDITIIFNSFVKQADEAMYRSKRHGKNQVTIYKK